MSVQQRSYFCQNCQQQRLFTRHGMNHTPHILASIFLCGMWLPIWILMAIFYDAGFYCAHCGYSDSPRHLANSNLHQQRQEQMAYLAQQTERYFHLFVQWFKSLTLKWKIVVIAAPIVSLAFLNFINTPSKKADFTNKNSNSNANLFTNPSPSSSVVTANTNSAPETLDFNKPEIKARITKGKQIYKRIESRTGLPIMFSWRAQKMSLLIPTNDWNKMSKEDQINLTYYAENLVQEIKKYPALYAKKWTDYYKSGGQVAKGMQFDGLTESSYINEVEKLCSSCWSIAIGKVYKNDFSDDEHPVTGENVQNFRAQK